MKSDFKVPTALRAYRRNGPILSLGQNYSDVFPHFHQESWLAQVHGEKLWVLSPPNGAGLSKATDKALRSAHTQLNACQFSAKMFAGPWRKREFLWCVVKP